MRTRKAPQADRAGGWPPSRGLGRHDQGCGGGGAPRTAARGGWRWARAGRAGWGRFPSATMGQPTRLAWLHRPRPTQRLWGVAAGHPRGQRPIHLPESEAIGRASGERGACHGVLALGPPSWAHPHPQRLTDGGINKSAKRDQLQPRARSIRSGRSMVNIQSTTIHGAGVCLPGRGPIQSTRVTCGSSPGVEARRASGRSPLGRVRCFGRGDVHLWK